MIFHVSKLWHGEINEKGGFENSEFFLYFAVPENIYVPTTRVVFGNFDRGWALKSQFV